MMRPADKILITGAGGFAGSNLVRFLRAQGFQNVVGLASRDCDLTNFEATQACFNAIQPAYVFHLAGYVFDIMGNMLNQAESYLRNTLINTHVIEASHKARVKKIMAMGTVAMYPDPLPSDSLREDMIWAGAPHNSERGYAHAKRGMLAQLEVSRESYGLNYVCAISTNLYGPHDRFNSDTGHVIPSLVHKFYEAKRDGNNVTVWGDGSAKRDFLYIDDTSRGLCVLMEKLEGPVNLATGRVNSIREAVEILAAHTNMQDRIRWDTSKPNGQPYRAYDISKLAKAGFICQINLKEGLQRTYDWYAANAETARR